MTVLAAALLAVMPLAWGDAPARPFISGELGAGAIARAQVAAGYGRPHWQWLGVEAQGTAITEFASTYAGLRGKLPFAEASLGARSIWSFRRAWQPEAPGHGALVGSPRVHYTAWDASATLAFPLPWGYGSLWCDFVVPRGLPEGKQLYEEHMRAVVGRGLTAGLRFLYLVRLGDDGHLAGPIVEHVWLGGRDQNLWRLGAAVFWRWTRHLDLGAVLTMPVSGPDDLSLKNGVWGTGMVRWRWATGDPPPRWP